MPVPMIAPTPNAVSCQEPTTLFSSWCDSCVSVSSDETSRVANRPGFFLPTTSVICFTSARFGLYRAPFGAATRERLKIGLFKALYVDAAAGPGITHDKAAPSRSRQFSHVWPSRAST